MTTELLPSFAPTYFFSSFFFVPLNFYLLQRARNLPAGEVTAIYLVWDVWTNQVRHQSLASWRIRGVLGSETSQQRSDLLWVESLFTDTTLEIPQRREQTKSPTLFSERLLLSQWHLGMSLNGFPTRPQRTKRQTKLQICSRLCKPSEVARESGWWDWTCHLPHKTLLAALLVRLLLSLVWFLCNLWPWSGHRWERVRSCKAVRCRRWVIKASRLKNLLF